MTYATTDHDTLADLHGAAGAVALPSAAERRLMLAPLIAPGAQKIRLLLLEAVLGISDGVEAVLSSAADALIQPLLL